MPRAEFEQIRQRLLQLRENLLMELRQKQEQATSPIDEGAWDIGDRGLDDNLRELLHLLGEGKRREILDIDDALSRLNRGGYGVCEECGEAIGKGRLEVQPYTLYCTECQQSREKEEAAREGPHSRGQL